MLLTTTPSLEDQSVREYLGIVTGEAIIGANILKDIMAAVRDKGRRESRRCRASSITPLIIAACWPYARLISKEPAMPYA